MALASKRLIEFRRRAWFAEGAYAPSEAGGQREEYGAHTHCPPNSTKCPEKRMDKMKLFTLSILIFLTISANAQTGTFFEAGLGGSYGSNAREKSVPEVYGGLGFKVAEFKDSTIQLRARAKYAEKSELADLFTRDNNATRMPSGELLTGFEGRWNLSTESYFKPFGAVGFEYRRQFGLQGAPYSSLNPTITFGTRIGYGYEIFYTRLFEDRLNRSGFPVQQVNGVLTGKLESSRLKGDRIGASYLVKLRGRLHLKIGSEFDRVSYRACSNRSCDAYREYDWIGRGFVSLSVF